jgi:hypothetical protein
VSSGGRGSYYSNRDLSELKELAIERLERSRNEQEVASLLAEKLAAINNRDADEVNERLDQIRAALGDAIDDFERLRFGGSVAKHTFVDGLSDVDSLVLLHGEAAATTPEQVLNELKQALDARLGASEVESISVGRLAVTVRYRDGDELQLLPAIRRGDAIAIADATGRRWSSGIDPQSFARALTGVNQSQGGMVVPTVKLAKSILYSALGDQAPSGYHVEALAVDAFRGYTGPRSHRDMLTHLLAHSAAAVRRPTRDITGQSINVDESLGSAESPSRVQLSRRLDALAKKVAGGSPSEWRELLE